MMFLIPASAAVATSAATPIHSAEISYASSAYPASAETESTVRFHDVEPRLATRATTPACRWRGGLFLNRAVSADGRPVAQQNQAILLRELAGVQALSVKGG